MNTYVSALAFFALVASVASECNCPNKSFFYNISPNTTDIITKVMFVYNNKYHTAADILNATGGFPVLSSEQDHYNVDQEEQCFLAILDDAMVEVNDTQTNTVVNIKADIAIRGEVAEGRTATMICHCVQRTAQGFKFCDELLPNGITSRMDTVKCRLEGNCDVGQPLK